MRLDKLLAHTGHGTRKQVRQLIKKGFVTVDGETMTTANKHIDLQKEIVCVNGEQVQYEKYIYLMLHKPKNVITATEDRIDQTVIDLVPEKYTHVKLSPVGRLDKDTEGLILLTNDGKLNHLLTSPKSNIWKTYIATVDGLVSNEHERIFTRGVTLDDGYETKPAKLKVMNRDVPSTVEISITEGKFHQVKRMFRAIGMNVLYLKRIKIGELALDENLALGECRSLDETEISWLTTVKRGDEHGSAN